MLSKRGYLIHFARLFFASLLYGISSLLSRLWNKYQLFDISFQLQRCQSSITTNKISDITIWHWLNNFHFANLFPSFSFLSTSNTQKCHYFTKVDYPIDINKLIELIHSILFIYFVYHSIHLSLFHCNLKRLHEKQHYYARLYRQDQGKRKEI
ncbi:unnamed protein product [Rotaria socialis]|uniref:Uncharacterized protein n=1 Tax=Rotaria socialis TaxID=392032 RepID=A0A821A495_9BILA|nr:unnamed protein product [Rotaria socialis]CAF3346306.1 unnamed protein product [Rotaria socialis]CAF3354824.1 unnamed protein product [Rotaria socialis]CAF3381738.1 unnamed protein product [Rotaria socialis]CAF3401146.1 unnamed protein product [Rotaria socialis]